MGVVNVCVSDTDVGGRVLKLGGTKSRAPHGKSRARHFAYVIALLRGSEYSVLHQFQLQQLL